MLLEVDSEHVSGFTGRETLLVDPPTRRHTFFDNFSKCPASDAFVTFLVVFGRYFDSWDLGGEVLVIMLPLGGAALGPLGAGADGALRNDFIEHLASLQEVLHI